MTATQVITTLRARGIEVRATPKRKVRLIGPMSRYHDLLDELHRYRDEILSLLPAPAIEFSDPRADMLEDSHLWRRLLGMAWELDGQQSVGLCANLSCLRCLGATLVRPDGRLRFRSSGDYWLSEDAFQAECRKFLEPYKAALTKMLRTIESQEVAA